MNFKTAFPHSKVAKNGLGIIHSKNIDCDCDSDEGSEEFESSIKGLLESIAFFSVIINIGRRTAFLFLNFFHSC